MSAALELVYAVEANGGRFRVEGEYLVIAPEEAAAPVMEELRLHKAEIVELLARRPAMPAGVRLVSWNPSGEPIRLSPCETVTDNGEFIRSTLRQLEAALEGRSGQAGNWGLCGLLERLASAGCIVALDDRRRLLQ